MVWFDSDCYSVIIGVWLSVVSVWCLVRFLVGSVCVCSSVWLVVIVFEDISISFWFCVWLWVMKLVSFCVYVGVRLLLLVVSRLLLILSIVCCYVGSGWKVSLVIDCFVIVVVVW